MSCGGEICRTGSGAVAAAEQRESVQVVVDIVCGGGESDQAQTSTSTRTDDAAVKTETKVWGCLVAAKLQDWFRGVSNIGVRGGRVRVVVDSICGGGEVRSSANFEVNDDG